MLFDKVLETSTTTGTGTLNLAGAPAGYRTFVAAAGSGNPAFYHIQDRADSTIWEAGYGTVTDASPDTLTRNLLVSSTGSLINFAAGTRDVYSYSSGTALASVMKGHISATGRPAWLQAGATWIDSSATPWVWHVFDGTDNIQIATINATTNVLTLKGITDLLATANTWTADQTIRSSDGGTTGAQLTLDHASASPAVSDEVGRQNFKGRNNVGEVVQYAGAVGVINGVTDGAENGRYQIRTMQAGTEQDVALFGLGGWMRTAAGTDPGVGKFNAVELQQQGQPVQRKLAVAKLVDAKASGTNGGTSVADTWTKHTLTEETDADGIVSVASSVFTLGAGTYIIDFAGSFSGGSADSDAALRIQNTSDGTTAGKSTNGGTMFAGDENNTVSGTCITTIAGSKNFELQYYHTVAVTNVGLGSPLSSGEDEIYAWVKILRIA